MVLFLLISSNKNLTSRNVDENPSANSPSNIPIAARGIANNALTAIKEENNNINYDLSEEEKQCDCGCQKERFGEEITEQLDIVPKQLKVIRHVRPKYVCKKCEGNISIAPMPNLLLPKSIAAPGLVADAIADAGVFFKVRIQAFVHDGVHDALYFAVAEFHLRLAFDLRFLHRSLSDSRLGVGFLLEDLDLGHRLLDLWRDLALRFRRRKELFRVAPADSLQRHKVDCLCVIRGRIRSLQLLQRHHLHQALRMAGRIRVCLRHKINVVQGLNK